MENKYDDVLRNLDGKQNNEHHEGVNELKNFANENMSNTLGKVERIDYTKDIIDDNKREYGYFDLDPKNFPSNGLFYKDDIKIKIRSAQVKEIRNFSALDEENPLEVDEAIIELLTSCVRVSYSNKVGSWKDILEEDRLYLILSIRELTFAEEETTLSFKVKCGSCNTENNMEIKNENFQKRELPEKIMKYYSKEDLGFNIQTRSFGTFFITPPTAGVMRHVSSYIKELKDNKENLKEYISFLKVLPYLLQDWRTFKRKDIDNLRIQFVGWNDKKFVTFTELCELMQVSVKDKMLKHCDKCGDPIEADVQLPTGIKGLFIANDILDNELI